MVRERYFRAVSITSMLSRRSFVVWISGAVPVAIVARRADALGAAWIRDDAVTLADLAALVLPSELGVDGARRVARAFQRWLDGYVEDAELVHGYGTSALRFARPSPRARWAEQLERLRAQFASASAAQRREIVRAALAGDRLDRMPDVASAPHVAVALLSFYFNSADAADLCYGARIGRESCRPLAAQARKPLPLARGARGAQDA